ncbi:MAG: helicase-like protein [Polaromonas sp.]|nr:helicase-like protein [Polaromonas sp.]
MNILLVSQCDKRALSETRRILDQFAERRGDRTWQTPITQAGLDTLRRLLKKTARKNTAVACHWIRGLDHSELLWTVGDARAFNAQGAVPTNSTARNILRGEDENDWHTGEDIHLLAGLAALLHDLGKASRAFQMRLEGKLQERNQYRHEWVSLRLFEAFVGLDDDAAWLARLAAPMPADDATWLNRSVCDGPGVPASRPFARLAHAPLAQAIGWLVVTHHRLPTLPRNSDGSRGDFQIGLLNKTLERIDAGWNERTDSGDAGTLPLYWQFPHGLPVTTELWRKRAARLAQRLLLLRARPGKGGWLANPYVMHLSRLCLMLADHHYSSLTTDAAGKPDPARVKGIKNYPLFANTDQDRMNQALDEHLLGVAQHSGEVTHALPRFDQHLARLRHKALRKRSQDERFRWQDKAADTAAGMRERSTREGAFIVNMASTGCGKTLANARIMYALADPCKGMRCAFAMGLRTLTLQTGRAFADLLGLGDDELAIRVGGAASRALFDHYEQQAEATGSASRQALIDEDSAVVFEGNHDAHPLLRRVMRDPQVRSLLAAPVLVCTIDHLTPATESERGGRQIAPMLRLMSGDLVLDEPDDFDIGDLPALTRLVHWAGLLGARVLLSSATFPPALVQGLFEAYRDGRQHFQRNRSSQPGAADRAPGVCCAWVDEFSQAQSDCTDAPAFATAHQAFAELRRQHLAKAKPLRRYGLLPLDLGADRSQHAARFAELARGAALRLHQAHHSLDTQSGNGSKRVSFGLIRMANIEQLVDVALALYRQGAPDGVRIHLCAYHSQFPLLIRSAIEHQLDEALNRRQPDAVFALPGIRQRLDAHGETDHLFIVLGSPVTEVGRDHDYDWAVVEPSSMRSLIQLAGRIRRHRGGECTVPNLLVFDTNLRHFREPGHPAFCKPGFESPEFPLTHHFLKELLPVAENGVIDARPRIVAPAGALQPRSRLVDLEHARMRQTMLAQVAAAPATPGLRQRASAQAGAVPVLNAASWWSLPPADALLTAVLPQQQRFRDDPVPRVDLVLRPNEDEDNYELEQLIDKPDGRRGEKTFFPVDKSQNHRIPDADVEGQGIKPWGQTDYWDALTALAAELDMPLADCARRFGTVTLPKHPSGWRFHPVLGFTKYR